MAWSTPSVLCDTLARADACGLHVAPLDTLPRLQDIDTLQDLRDWLASVADEQQPRKHQEQQRQQGDGALGAVAAGGHATAGEERLPGGAAAGGGAGQAGMAALARQRREELLRVCARIVGQYGQEQGQG